MGNVIGSCLFNILAILVTTSLITPLTLPADIRAVDVWVLLAGTVGLIALLLFRALCAVAWGAADGWVRRLHRQFVGAPALINDPECVRLLLWDGGMH